MNRLMTRRRRFPLRQRLAPSLARAAVAVALAFLALSIAEQASASHAPLATPLTIAAGVGTSTVFGNVFTPREVTVHVGDSVKWTIQSDEVHSITFGRPPNVPADVPPALWPASFNLPPGPPPVANLGTASYSGSEFINTGLIAKGASVTITFTQPGTWSYLCVIHPGMLGFVNVVGAGTSATTQAAADTQARAETETVLAEVEPLRTQAREQGFTTARRPDGTRLWTVPVNALTFVPTGPLELAEFIPPHITISQGDTVRWEATTPHTVTFLPPGTQPHDFDPLATPPSRPLDVYDGASLYNSGVFLFGPPPPVTNFELTFNDVGQFPYVCLLHWSVGQTGTVTVSGVRE